MNNDHFGFEDDPVQRRFGDPLAEHLEFLLHTSTPFPGEPIDTGEITGSDRFVAYRVSAVEHVLMDSAYDEDYVVPSACLANPDFEPLVWFARKLKDHHGLTVALEKLPYCMMGDPRAHRVVQILNQADVYPGDDLPEFHPKQDRL
ncbi:hypothetical protein F5880DRAFT_1493278, partial [Lentinula raphanica]